MAQGFVQDASASAPPSARAARRCWPRCCRRSATTRTLAKLGDDRVLSEMARRVFSAGFVWSVIDQKWPGFEEAFLGFNPKRLLFQPAEFWHDLASDKRIVRNPQKIKSVRENAKFVSDIAAEHGSFGKFLADLAGRRPGRPDGGSRQARLAAGRQYLPVPAALPRPRLLHPDRAT